MAKILIIGLGTFGAAAAKALEIAGHRVTAVDLDSERVQRVAPTLERVISGDATDPALLQQLDLADFDSAIISTGDDVTASALAAITLRDLGVADIRVKVVSDLHIRILEKVGVHSTIFPAREAADHLARRMGNAN